MPSRWPPEGPDLCNAWVISEITVQNRLTCSDPEWCFFEEDERRSQERGSDYLGLTYIKLRRCEETGYLRVTKILDTSSYLSNIDEKVADVKTFSWGKAEIGLASVFGDTDRDDFVVIVRDHGLVIRLPDLSLLGEIENIESASRPPVQ